MRLLRISGRLHYQTKWKPLSQDLHRCWLITQHSSNLKAPVLFSNLSVADLLDPKINAKKSAVERHHLFPKGYLYSIGIKEVRDTNQVANFALVEWNDNIDISDVPPSKYFKVYQDRYSKDEWKKINFLHALPDRWYDMKYPDFLEARGKAMAQVIRKGFEKL